MDTSFLLVVVLPIVLVILFLLLRGVVCWYYKIDTMVTLLEEQNELIRRQLINLIDLNKKTAEKD